MKIEDFQDLVSALPYLNHSFTIKSKNWQCDSQTSSIESIFEGHSITTINRFDLINANHSLPEFVLKTLMWGYPTMGRGSNIKTLLRDQNLEKLIKVLKQYQDQPVTIEQIQHDLKEIDGLGMSTMTKFLSFLNVRINGNETVILDQRIMDVINFGTFEELEKLKGIRHDNAINKYVEYLETINKLALNLKAVPAQIEMFIFIFGKSLSEVRGENCYDYD